MKVTMVFGGETSAWVCQSRLPEVAWRKAEPKCKPYEWEASFFLASKEAFV
jgi:hypothetical protein